MFNQIKQFKRINKQLLMFATDSILLIIILLASFSVRLGYWYFPTNNLILLILISPVIAIPIFKRFGLYTAVTRHIGIDFLWQASKACSLYALIWGILALMSGVDGLPRSVVLINWFQTLLVILGLRVLARKILYGSKLTVKNISVVNVLIYGAGDAGIQLVSALKQSSQYKPVGFIDDSKELHNRQVLGLNIYSIYKLDSLIKKFHVEEILIAMPSISRNARRQIINKLENFPVIVRILPGVSELVQGKVSINDLRKVNIKDLLGRNIVQSNKELLGINVIDKVVLVTGAGGSIGSELSRQILLLKPKSIVLFEINELALYSIEREMLEMNFDPEIKIFPVLGNINDKSRVGKVINYFSVNTIYHSAAYKHVPMVELNNAEGVNNNIFGTYNCALAAIAENVETFVLISTDKAVRPTNTMGASKRCAELILQALSLEGHNTKFSMVRFGNVLGSSGSVIPLFEDQIKQGGPITVTDKNIVRYFMTIPEAVELVIQAGSMSEGGDVFVLDMGKPIKIYDLAVKMINLSGLKLLDDENPTGDIEIKFTGLRPGEKLYEELLVGSNTSKTKNELIMRAKEDMLEMKELKPLLKDLRKAISIDKYSEIREVLIKIVPEFSPQSPITDLLFEDL
jgi:FlaA1/EpsC-like NDP-sugar epimerase